jgi:ribonuclease HI
MLPAMPKKRPKQTIRRYTPSPSPLPARLAPAFAGLLQVFSDASQRRHGGLAAVLFADAEAEPLVVTRTVAIQGSNELELQAVLFALAQARLHFPGRPLALFSDNRDAIDRLDRACRQGLAADPALAALLAPEDLAGMLALSTFRWVRAHASCRGNLLADRHAALAAA